MKIFQKNYQTEINEKICQKMNYQKSRFENSKIL